MDNNVKNTTPAGVTASENEVAATPAAAAVAAISAAVAATDIAVPVTAAAPAAVIPAAVIPAGTAKIDVESVPAAADSGKNFWKFSGTSAAAFANPAAKGRGTSAATGVAATGVAAELAPEQRIAELTKSLKAAEKTVKSQDRQYKRLQYSMEILENSFNARLNAQTMMLEEQAKRGKYLDLLFRNTDDLVVFMDVDGRLLYCTDSFVRLCGANKYIEFSGKLVSELAELDDTGFDFKRMSEWYRIVAETRSPLREQIHLDIDNDEHKRHEYNVNFLPLLTGGHIFDGVVASYFDVTALVTALEKAQQADKAKSDFLMSMSHEIRTPMNAIIGMGELINPESLDEQQKGYLDEMKRVSHSFLDMISDILDFSKIETGKFELTPVDYDLYKMADNLASLANFIKGSKPVEVVYDIAESLPRAVYGDEMRVRQVVSNILNNAVKFTDRGRVIFKIRRDDPREGETALKYLEFVVSDTGKGISSEFMENLFTPFNQQGGSVNNRGVMGTGLGLAITKRFVDLMGGTVSVESAPGVGSVFTVRVPLIKGDEKKLENLGDTDCVIADGSVKVLVVDDNSMNLNVAKGFLKRHGINADLADSGEKAVEMTQKCRYDLIYMDHMMPSLDGVETTAIIRRNGFTNPIVALTANVVAGAKEFFLENGMDDFVPKPIDAVLFNQVLYRNLPPSKVKSYGEGGAERRRVNTVYVVDDSAGGRKVFSRVLDNSVVIEFGDSRSVLETLENRRPDFIILEPDLTGGFEVIRRAAVPVIAVTRLKGDEFARVKRAGVAACIVKPFKASELRAVVARVAKA